MLASQEPAGARHAAGEAAQSEATGRGKRIARRVTRQCFIRGRKKFRGRLLKVEQLAQYFERCAARAAAAKKAAEEERWERRQLEGEVLTALPSSVAPQLASAAAASSCSRLEVVQCTSCSLLRRSRRPLREARRQGVVLMALCGAMLPSAAKEKRDEEWHLYSWCRRCKSVKPAWDRLTAEFQDSADRIVADADGIGTGMEMSEQVGDEGLHVAMNGDSHDQQDFDGGGNFESLQKFVQGLGPQSGTVRRKLCDEGKQKAAQKCRAVSETECQEFIAVEDTKMKKNALDFPASDDDVQRQCARDLEPRQMSEEGLGSQYWPAHKELYDKEKKTDAQKYRATSAVECQEFVDVKMKKVESDFQAFVEGLQKQYTEAAAKKIEDLEVIKNMDFRAFVEGVQRQYPEATENSSVEGL